MDFHTWPSWVSPDGKITLVNADCYEVASRIPDGSVDMINTDPPYGVTDCEWDKLPDFTSLWGMFRRVCKLKSPMVITACQPFTSVLVSSNLKDFRVEWIWQKNAGSNIGTVKWYPMKEHESVLVFAVGGPPSPYNAIRQTRAKPVKTGFRKNGSAFKNGGVTSGTIRGKDGGFTVTDGEMRVPSSVQSFSRERGLHPTQKPVALCEYFTRTYSNEPDLVFDPYAGSASTAIACAKLKRRYLGVEKDSTYFEAAVKRLSSHYSEK